MHFKWLQSEIVTRNQRENMVGHMVIAPIFFCRVVCDPARLCPNFALLLKTIHLSINNSLKITLRDLIKSIV